MCGIGGAINFEAIKCKNKKPLHKNILDFLYHRGPDEQNYISYKNTLLAHTRLAIQDIQNGSQPFCIDGAILVFNGEIYNHQELRNKYLSEYKFKTSSDSETLLYLYKEYGEKIFDMLDGMFALAILDKEKKELILATDRAGKKPLYYYHKDNIFFFASELNVISKTINLQIQEEHINSYLRCGFFYKHSTPYKDVYQLEQGSFAKINLQVTSMQKLKLDKKKYFNILDLYNTAFHQPQISFQEALMQTKEALQKSVKNRLISSDLEVGAFLSGGIDSSLVVALSSKILNKPIKTFTVSFEDSNSYDESHLAKLVADKYNTSHNKISINMDNLSSDIDGILSSFGEPFFDSSAIPSFYVAQEAKKYVSVVLNGDGADELFGGYRRYVAMKYNSFFSIFSQISHILPLPKNKKNIYSHLYRALKMSMKKNLDFYLSSSSDIFEDSYSIEDNYLLNDFRDEVSTVFDLNLDLVSKMLYLDFSNILYSDLLKKIDITSMHYALEARSPFLSKYMIELAPQIPTKYKINNITTKYILRELSKEYIPQELVNQPKRGFEIPLVKWVNNDLKDNIFDSLNNGYSDSFVDKKFTKNLLANKINISSEKRAKMLWSLFCLNSWKNNQ